MDAFRELRSALEAPKEAPPTGWLAQMSYLRNTVAHRSALTRTHYVGGEHHGQTHLDIPGLETQEPIAYLRYVRSMAEALTTTLLGAATGRRPEHVPPAVPHFCQRDRGDGSRHRAGARRSRRVCPSPSSVASITGSAEQTYDAPDVGRGLDTGPAGRHDGLGRAEAPSLPRRSPLRSQPDARRLAGMPVSAPSGRASDLALSARGRWKGVWPSGVPSGPRPGSLDMNPGGGRGRTPRVPVPCQILRVLDTIRGVRSRRRLGTRLCTPVAKREN